MSKFSSKKWGRKVLATVVAGSLALTMPMISSLQPLHVLADEGDTSTSTPTSTYYDAETDTLTLAGYNFYTLDKVDLTKKKLPDASKWIRTNSGEINLSMITKEKVVTFAKTLDLDADNTDNFKCVTVPELKTISKVVYVPVPEEGKTKLQVTLKDKSKTVYDTISTINNVEFRVNNETEWTSYAWVVRRLDELGKTGASISVRVDGEGGRDVLDSEGKFKSDIVRTGTAKILKLAKKAAGPKVTIDYDNHVATIKKKTEYGEAGPTSDPTTYTPVTADTVVSLESGKYYGVRTSATNKKPASNATTIYVPGTTTLEAGENISVAVTTGGAILEIKTPATDTYQYLLLTEDAYGKVVETVDGSKCYKGSFATEKTNKNSYKWSSLKGKSADLKKTIKFAKNTTPTRLLVRKAGNKKTGVYSTSIVVFTLGDSAWDNGATSLGYGGTTASGDESAGEASATATFKGTSTVPIDDEVTVSVTIDLTNANGTNITYDKLTISNIYNIVDDEDVDMSANLSGEPLATNFVAGKNQIKVDVKITNNHQSKQKSFAKFDIALPGLGIDGNKVTVTKAS